ncbi:MAG: hypothetical protein JKY41_05095 [Rhodobacteraceae bacterium]|nr:hypothetical protein [Paracoccaceae bacterium]
MPHPIRNLKGRAARGGPKIVLERPELAKLMGAIAAEWGSIDNILAGIFNVVTLAKYIPVGAHSRSEMANGIFQNFISIRSRTDLIAQMIQLRLDEGIQKEFTDLTKSMTKKIKERNNLVHTEWQVCDDFPDDLIKTTSKGWVRFTENDLTEMLEQHCNMRNQMQDFFIKVSHADKKEVD